MRHRLHFAAGAASSLLFVCPQEDETWGKGVSPRMKRPFSFWELIHEVDGLLLLVIPEDMLPSRGLEILESFKSKIQNPIQRRLWLGSDKDEVSGPLPKIFVKPLIGGFAALFVFLVERSTMLLEIVIGAAPSSTNPATVQINVGNEVQAFLVRAALGLVAGFFADRVLSSTMERVLGRILVKSEKTLTRGPKPEEAGASPR